MTEEMDKMGIGKQYADHTQLAKLRALKNVVSPVTFALTRSAVSLDIEAYTSLHWIHCFPFFSCLIVFTSTFKMANAFLFWTILALSDFSLNFNLFPTLSLSLEHAVSKEERVEPTSG